jgi:hypothetical protein
LYLVANKKLGNDLITGLTQTIMRVRRQLLSELPIFAQTQHSASTPMPTFRCIPERQLSTTAPSRASWMNRATGFS